MSLGDRIVVPDVSLADEHAGVVDRLGKTQLEDLGLQTALQEVLNLQAEHVIELHAALVQHANADQTTQKSITCEDKTLIRKLLQAVSYVNEGAA